MTRRGVSLVTSLMRYSPAVREKRVGRPRARPTGHLRHAGYSVVVVIASIIVVISASEPGPGQSLNEADDGNDDNDEAVDPNATKHEEKHCNCDEPEQ